jgi:hypothetical protein
MKMEFIIVARNARFLFMGSSSGKELVECRVNGMKISRAGFVMRIRLKSMAHLIKVILYVRTLKVYLE